MLVYLSIRFEMQAVNVVVIGCCAFQCINDDSYVGHCSNFHLRRTDMKNMWEGCCYGSGEILCF